MSQSFTWIPLYGELARLLLGWEGRQKELIEFLMKLRENGLKSTPLNDKDTEGNSIVPSEIDPFTFLGAFNRQTRDDERLAILAEVKQFLGAQSPLPDDFHGVPVLNNQRSWFVEYEATRGRHDVEKLWNVFRHALGEDPLHNPDFKAAFDEAMRVKGTATNLTMGLFWIRPDTLINLDSINRAYLKIKLPSQGITSDFYLDTVKRVMAVGKPLPDVSHDAWQAAESEADQAAVDEAVSNETGYWLVGAHWGSTDPPDQVERFLSEGIWQDGHKEKHRDEILSIKVRDRIAIKAATTQKHNLPFDGRGKTASKMIIKAAGTVVANRGDGRTVDVEWEPGYEPRDWFFYTYQSTINRLPTDEDHKNYKYARRLIDFVWHGAEQDYDWFCQQWFDGGATEPGPEKPDGPDDVEGTYEPYNIDDIIASGIFLDEPVLRQTLSRLESKKNLILQGPPGVGKTFIARKIAYALMEEKADSRIEMVQFHQTYSYEDFVRGYRPLPDKAGTFGLQDAIFYEFCKRAEDDADRAYVFIIDEINRGNLSQIFGELLMLIESDKRRPEYAVPLVYRKPGERPFYIPENVHLIGLMNLADRSLAIVDYALRRRFGFVSLTPKYESDAFRSWLLNRRMDEHLVDLITARMTALNKQIKEDPLLGEHYQVGHSFFCPKGDDFAGLDRPWFDGVIDTEIAPLLREYWFDNTSRAEEAVEALVAP